MAILTKEGFLFMTDGNTPVKAPYNPGLYKFVFNQGSTNQPAIKLAKNILGQLKSKNAKQDGQLQYTIDAITGIKPGAFSMYQKGQ
jgi:hypothetical protein